MLRFVTSIILCAATAFLEPARAESPLFEGTLFGGYHYGGEFEDQNANEKIKLKSGASFGASLNLRQSDGAYYELNYNRQNAQAKSVSGFDSTIEYLHLGGYISLDPDAMKMIPYFLLTAGVTRFRPDQPDLRTVFEPSIAIGGGMKFPLANHFALRAELRGYATFVDSDSKLFCASQSTGLTCNISIKSTAFLQAQGLLGAVVSF